MANCFERNLLSKLKTAKKRFPNLHHHSTSHCQLIEAVFPPESKRKPKILNMRADGHPDDPICRRERAAFQSEWPKVRDSRSKVRDSRSDYRDSELRVSEKQSAGEGVISLW